MKIRTSVLVVFSLKAIFVFAQEDKIKEKIRYSNLTEFGIIAANPCGVSLEAITIHGFSIEKKRYLGLGTGIGICFHKEGFVTYKNPYTYTVSYATAYLPVLLNYRLYFKPEKKISPHINIAVGGLAVENSAGVYSSIAMGFKAGAFSFSSGLSFMPFCVKENYYLYYHGDCGNVYMEATPTVSSRWHYPFGFTFKTGFTF